MNQQQLKKLEAELNLKEKLLVEREKILVAAEMDQEELIARIESAKDELSLLNKRKAES